MNWFVSLLLVLAVALVQVAIMPSFNIFGAHPNLMIITMVLIITLAGQREALFPIVAGGFALSLLDAEELGVTMLALAPLVLLSEVRELRLLQPDLLLAVTLVALATAAYEGILLGRLTLTGAPSLGWEASLLDVLLPAIIANVLVALPAYGLARLWPALAGPAPRRAY